MVIILIRGKDKISPPEDEMPALAYPSANIKGASQWNEYKISELNGYLKS